MKIVNIRLKNLETAAGFVDEMERLNVNADISYGNHSLDAKSLMGILTVDLGRVLELRINEDDELCDRIIGRIAEYLA
ncbi:MAG: HPr family phosphocarrier protein [Agathobacter sp.]|nr:HPr family phosphocarrier protein [Agathobacter sp.]